MVLIDSRVFPLINISVTGLSFQASGYRVGERITLKVAKFLNMKDCIQADIFVKVSTDTVTRAEFYSTMPLMRYIIRHISEVTGTPATYFKP